jgi:hypothetical protein
MVTAGQPSRSGHPVHRDVALFQHWPWCTRASTAVNTPMATSTAATTIHAIHTRPDIRVSVNCAVDATTLIEAVNTDERANVGGTA